MPTPLSIIILPLLYHFKDRNCAKKIDFFDLGRLYALIDHDRMVKEEVFLNFEKVH